MPIQQVHLKFKKIIFLDQPKVSIRGEVEKHKKELESLKRRDPEFAQYLRNQADNLLEFGEDAEAEEEQEPEDDETQDLTVSTLKGWINHVLDQVRKFNNILIDKQSSVTALKKILAAFRFAALENVTDDELKQKLSIKSFNYKISSSKVLNNVTVFCVKNCRSIFDLLLKYEYFFILFFNDE
jgi:nucleolar complex protein 2